MEYFDMEDFMLRYLKRVYPIVRLKYNNRFRRAIAMDRRVFILQNTNKNLHLQTEVLKVLDKVFASPHSTNMKVLQKYFNLK